MSKPVINVDDAPVHRGEWGERFEFAMAELSRPLGARSIGANVTRVPPGKAAFPLHHHHANEEHFFILSGTGVLRLGAATHPVKARDYVVCLPGGAGAAHQFVNTGAEDLVYLAISTLVVPEVVGYPETGKTSVRTSMEEGADARFLLRNGDRNAVGYWEGEDGAGVARVVNTARQAAPGIAGTTESDATPPGRS
jgi:uncharacterized cupin superfamily protein